MGELRVEHVPCFLHTEIQGEKIPEVPDGLPFTAEFLDKLLANCPVVTEIIRDNEDDDTPLYGAADTISVGLHRISKNHGRSYELSFGNSGDINRPLALWSDGNENYFSSLSLKGNNFSNPHIFRSLTAPSGYIPHGLQETNSFLRVVRASRLMSEANVGTEKVVRVIEPQLFRAPMHDPETDKPIENSFEFVPLAECKRRLLINHWNRIADKPNALEEFSEARKAIQEMSFFITLRAMSVGNRILDLCGSKESFVSQLEHIFRVLEPLTVHEEGEGPLSIENKDHIEWFLTNYLPSMIGIHLARLHKLGLMHTFPTLGNINALGDLVDLDSVKGSPLGLGDAELTEDDYFSDLTYFMQEQQNSEDMYQLAKNFLDVMGDAYKPDLDGADMAGITEDEIKDDILLDYVIDRFKARLLSMYIGERFNLKQEEEYVVSEENLTGFLDFIDLDIQKGDCFGYEGFIQEVLKAHLSDTNYSMLIDETAQQQLVESFINWGTTNAAETAMEMVTSRLRIYNAQQLDNDAELELGVYHETMNDLGRNERLYRYNTATEYMETTAFTNKLKQWLETHIKEDSSFSKDVIARAVVTGLREIIARKTYVLSIDGNKHPGLKVNFFAEQLARELYTNEDLQSEVHGLLVDNTVCAFWSRMPQHVLEHSINTREDILLIRHEPRPLESEVSIASSDQLRLQQVFHDGQLVEDFYIRQHGAFGEGATLTFKPHPDSTYLVFTIFDADKNTLHMHTYQKKPL